MTRLRIGALAAALALTAGWRACGEESPGAADRTTRAARAHRTLGPTRWLWSTAPAAPPDAGGPPETADAGPPSTGLFAARLAERLCPAAVEILCDADRRWGCDALLENERERDQPSCEDDVEGSCNRWVGEHYGALEDASAIRESELEACLAGIARDAADGSPAILEGCHALGGDAAREGEPCSDPWMPWPCGEGGECREGVCWPPAREGESCADIACASGLRCAEDQTCVRRPARGAPCDAEEGIAEEQSYFCAEPFDRCLTGRCRPHLELAEACTSNEVCAPGARCVMGRCAPEAHGACSTDEECGRDRICWGDYEERCERPQTGGACATYLDCPAGLECADGRCEVPDASAPCAFLLCPPGEVCTWHTAGGRCAAALCGQVDPFADACRS